MTGPSPETKFQFASGWAIDPATENLVFRFEVTATMLGQEHTPEKPVEVGEVGVTMLAVFDTGGESPPTDVVDEFGATELAAMMTPFLREHVSSLATRLGFGGVVLPMLVRSPLEAALRLRDGTPWPQPS